MLSGQILAIWEFILKTKAWRNVVWFCILSILNHDTTDLVLYYLNVAIRCGLIAILLYEINGTPVNRARTLLYAVAMMLTIGLPLLTSFKDPLAFDATNLMGAVLSYTLIQLRNPIWMVLCYFLTVKILKLPRKSIANLLVSIYCAYQVHVCLAAVVEIAMWSTLSALNLMPDAGNHGTFISMSPNVLEEIATLINTLMLAVAWAVVRRYIKANQHKVKLFAEAHAPDPARTVLFQFAQITALWLITAAGVFTGNVGDQYIIIAQAGYSITLVIIHVLIIYLSYYLKLRNIQTKYLAKSNKAMTEAIAQFRGIKHDFSNILQTYDGFFEIGDMERLRMYHEVLRGKTIAAGERLSLQSMFDERPAILGLLSNALDDADTRNVHFDLLHADLLNHVDITEFDLCRVLGNLLNNAIEHAAQTKARAVSFSAQPQPDGKCILILSNSTDNQVQISELFRDGYTTKAGHSGHGLAEVNRILAGSFGCTIMPNCTEDTFTMYLCAPMK